ncbi:MAG TPA: hypothetical protein VN805_05915 [Caulobacteraceae bacterium]|nr:hypothetical protein [Caulobacteraceae bacterium]
MHTIAAAGAGFLIAVLWFDLMFDVQSRGGPVASAAALASISAYYRRVTTEASPMGRLISLVMLATVAAIVAGMVRSEGPLWAGVVSLAAALIGMGLALVRTVRNAVRLGAVTDSVEVRSLLARRILADHLASLAAMSLVLALQIAT